MIAPTSAGLIVSRARRFENPVRVTERHVPLGGWDGRLSDLDKYLGSGETAQLYPFHQHVERVDRGGDALVVDFCINKDALPRGGPSMPVLAPPLARVGRPVTPGHGGTLPVS